MKPRPTFAWCMREGMAREASDLVTPLFSQSANNFDEDQDITTQYYSALKHTGISQHILMNSKTTTQYIKW